MIMQHFVLLSGGLDSSTLLAQVTRKYANDPSDPKDVYAVSIDYGQRHRKELELAADLAFLYGVRHKIIRLPGDLLAGHVLTDPKATMPNVSYAELPEGVSPTYVPFRNGLMLSLLAAFAQSECVKGKHQRGTIYYGAHAEDAARQAYPDCSPDFYDSMARAIEIGTYGMIQFSAPFLIKDKAAIVGIGHELGVPFAATWSCYKGGKHHCGVCPTCRSRRDAFKIAGVADPTIYQEHGEG